MKRSRVLIYSDGDFHGEEDQEVGNKDSGASDNSGDAASVGDDAVPSNDSADEEAGAAEKPPSKKARQSND